MEAKGWKLVDPGSAAGLDGSIAKAVERKENWVGYYWSPTAIIGKYDMRLLDFGVKWGGDDNWHKCVVKPEQECATPKKTRWVDSEVYSVVTDNFKKSAGPEAMKFMKNRIYPGTVMNSMLVYMTDNQAEGEDAAIEFMKKHEKVWSKWVSSSVAKKIKAGI
jgi:glycine betaine/proline transport system substrate-binding protein